VSPKVGAVKVLQLLAREHGVRNLHVDAERLGLADDADLSTVLAVLFEREAQTALALRPQRGYRTEDQSLPVVRGRLRLVDQALRRCGGNQTRAAALLGMNRDQIRYRVDKFGLSKAAS
jgi:5-methylcytosine-specific restriction enzyme subunit McrC